MERDFETGRGSTKRYSIGERGKGREEEIESYNTAGVWGLTWQQVVAAAAGGSSGSGGVPWKWQ